MKKELLQIRIDEELLNQMKINAKNQALTFNLKNILPLYESMYEKTIESFHAKEK